MDIISLGLTLVLAAIALDIALLWWWRGYLKRRGIDPKNQGHRDFIFGKYSPIVIIYKFFQQSWENIIILFSHSAEGENGDATSREEQKDYRLIIREWIRIVKRFALIAGFLLFSILPVWLVVVDRWFYTPLSSSLLYRVMQSIPLLKDMSYPPYFILIFICLAFLGLFILLYKEEREGFLKECVNAGQEINSSNVKSTRKWIGLFLVILAVLFVLIGVIKSDSEQIKGWFFIISICLNIIGLLLLDPPFSAKKIFQILISQRLIWLSFIIFHLALVFLLASYFSNIRLLLIAVLVFFVSSANLARYWRRIPPILWVMTLALLLFTMGINHWAYSVVGDEGDFFTYARSLAEQKNYYYIGSHLFDGQAVYGSHPFFSSALQAFFLKIFGSTYFGWRFSNCYFCFLSVGFFYLFYRKFVVRRIALLGAFFLATSHYIISFGKIGYNNLQAFFVMSIVLACSIWAVEAKNYSVYAVLGLCLGLCFYVYPAALFAVPIVILFLLFFDWPSPRIIGKWGVMLGSLGILVIPLFLQSGYWQAKVPGTFLANPAFLINSPNLFYHFFTNVSYSLFSYLFIPHETHFVVVSYVDPLTAILCSIGMVFTLKLFGKSRFIVFFVIAYLAMIFMVGASHDRRYPSSTRMFLLLPWFAMFAAIGIEWLKRVSWKLGCSPSIRRGGFTIFLVGVVFLNIVQAFPVSIRRSVGMESLEMLFFRLVQRSLEKQDDLNTPMTYLFITPENWGIDGFRSSQSVSDSPYFRIRLERLVINQQFLTEEAKTQIGDKNSLVIVYPRMDSSIINYLTGVIIETGKKPCSITALDGNTRFVLWYSPQVEWICNLATW